MDDVGEDEIESVIEATKRGKVDLDLGGTNWAKNPKAHRGRSSDGGLACVSRDDGSDGAGRSACAGFSGPHVGPNSAHGAVLDIAWQEDPVIRYCPGSRTTPNGRPTAA